MKTRRQSSAKLGRRLVAASLALATATLGVFAQNVFDIGARPRFRPPAPPATDGANAGADTDADAYESREGSVVWVDDAGRLAVVWMGASVFLKQGSLLKTVEAETHAKMADVRVIRQRHAGRAVGVVVVSGTVRCGQRVVFDK